MRALAVTPGVPDSDRLVERAEPHPAAGEALVQVVAVGVCATDREVIEHGEPPPGSDELIIGHESLGRVVRPAGALHEGDLVAAIVRRPDPVPCPECARGEWDMCSNGRYTERGIKGRDGYLAERYVEDSRFLVPVPHDLRAVGTLVEPASVIAKAIEQVERIQRRLEWEPRRALVTGAGPIGLLGAALLRARDLDVVVYDRAATGLKPELARAIGAAYVPAGDAPLHETLADAGIEEIDVAVEATGYAPLSFQLPRAIAPNGIVALTGISPGDGVTEVSADRLNLDIVLGNKVVFGTVNGNRRHFESAVADLARVADRWPGWLERIITTRVPLTRYREALYKQQTDIKAVIDLAG